MLKWTLIVIGSIVGLLLFALLAARIYYEYGGNSKVAEELRTQPDGERAARVMMLRFPDGRELPVNYLREDNLVFAGADGRWWRVFRDGDVPVALLIKGEEFTGRARTVLDDPDYTRDVFKRLRPDVPKWLPDWLNAYLVVIELDN